MRVEDEYEVLAVLSEDELERLYVARAEAEASRALEEHYEALEAFNQRSLESLLAEEELYNYTGP